LKPKTNGVCRGQRQVDFGSDSAAVEINVRQDTTQHAPEMDIWEANSVSSAYTPHPCSEDLYVSDASVFPSASGVNSMITNIAISDLIFRNISKELRRANGKSSRL
jgi:hypothetical protein